MNSREGEGRGVVSSAQEGVHVVVSQRAVDKTGLGHETKVST